MRVDEFPAPQVPLGADNAVDLDELDTDALETYVWFPGIENRQGDLIHPNWRGCTALGEVGDDASNAVQIDDTVTPQGMPISFSNTLLKRLDQGWVFYSYSVQKKGETVPGPESKRLFFYVGKRPSPATHLPVPQILQSHDLALDPATAAIPAEGVTISVPPYAAMAAQDKVTLRWRGFEDDGSPSNLNPSREVRPEDIGHPLTFLVARTQVRLIAGGRLELTYDIAYKGGGETSPSAQQNLRIVAPDSARLPALAIDGHASGPLDPERFTQGATLRIALYPGAQPGDVAMVHATVGTVTEAIAWVRLDPSTFDSNVLTVHLGHAWLLANNGKSARLHYQFARAGVVMSGESLSVLIRRPLALPLAVVSDTSQEQGNGPDEHTMDARFTTSGSKVRVHDDAVVSESDLIHVHWGVPDSPGHSVVTKPVPGKWREFDIPNNAIARNMGMGVGSRERLTVFYRVVPAGEPPENFQDSLPVRLKILPFPRDQFPRIQCELAQPDTGELFLTSVVDARGAEFKIRRWAYAEVNQIVNIKVVGKERYLLKEHLLTKSELDAASLSAWLPRDFMENEIGVDNKFKVSVTVSFDGGRSHIAFNDSPEITIRA
jgi:hypothetical protein